MQQYGSEPFAYNTGTSLDLNFGAVDNVPGASTSWEDWSLFTNDAMEQGRMGAAYPANGEAWDLNAATLGVSRLIDTATRAYVNVKGSQATTFAGQNGKTYTSGTQPPAGSGGGILPLLLIGAALLFLVK